MENKSTATYIVALKNGRFLMSHSPLITCEDKGAAQRGTKEEAERAVKILAEKHFIYGAQVIEDKQEGVKKSRRGTNIPKGSKWVVVDGKRKLVRPGEQAPQDEPTALAKECPDREPVVKKSLTTESALTWEDIKFIVRRADYVLEKHTKKELLEMGEQEYYERILNEVNAIKNLLK